MNAPTAWAERCRLLAEPIIEVCAKTSVTAGPSVLTREIARHLPEWSFREVLCRGGWYRLGGVVGESGARISDNIEQWAADALEERAGDLPTLLEDYAGSHLRATHITGRTHYFAAPGVSGENTDFLQLEIEDLQESLAQPLFGRQPPPGTLDELVDARCDECNDCGDTRCGVPVGTPAYRFRRLTHIGDLLARMRSQSLTALPIHRFVDDWERSSAGASTALCNHWSLALQEHLDRYRQQQISATPVAALNGELPRFSGKEGISGLSLQAALTAFDRAVGYPMAWFFHLVTAKRNRGVPHWVVAAVAADAAAGFSYLPDRDLAVIRQWLHQPYAF